MVPPVDRESIDAVVSAIKGSDVPIYPRYRREGAYGDQGAVFVAGPDGGEHQLIVPISAILRDYGLRTAEVVTMLAGLERRSPDELVSEVSGIDRTVASISVATPRALVAFGGVGLAWMVVVASGLIAGIALILFAAMAGVFPPLRHASDWNQRDRVYTVATVAAGSAGYGLGLARRQHPRR
jgi:hypothetical protein